MNFTQRTLLILAFAIAVDAHGRCKQVPFYDSWTQADIVFIGTAMESKKENAGFIVRFKIQRELKSGVDPTPSEFHSSGFENLKFEPGREYLVFANSPSTIPSCSRSRATSLTVGPLSLTDYEAELAVIQHLRINPATVSGAEKMLREKKLVELRKNAKTVCEARSVPLKDCLNGWEDCVRFEDADTVSSCSYSYFQHISKK
jgi:hypothetical protein